MLRLRSVVSPSLRVASSYTISTPNFVVACVAPTTSFASSSSSSSSSEQHLHNITPIAVEKGTTPASFSFAARYEKLRSSNDADSDSALASTQYEELMTNLKHYDGLLRTYSVKQTEIERARRAAKMCGLEMTGKKPRVDTTTVLGAAASASSTASTETP